MPQHRWLTFLVLIFITAVVFLFSFLHLRPVWTPNKNASQNSTSSASITSPTVTFVNPQKGTMDSKITIIEYSDFQCTACKELADNLETVLRTEPNIRIVWKDLPNESLHNLAVSAAVAARCAGDQKKFWEFHDLIFDNQITLSEESFTQIAQALGLDTDKFSQCYSNQDTLPLVKKDFEEGTALEITGTPTLFIGTERIARTLSAEEILKTIKQQTAAATTK